MKSSPWLRRHFQRLADRAQPGAFWTSCPRPALRLPSWRLPEGEGLLANISLCNLPLLLEEKGAGGMRSSALDYILNASSPGSSGDYPIKGEYPFRHSRF